MSVYSNRQNTTDPPKSKRRSVPHNKHSTFPGIKVNLKEVIVQSGSIKALKKNEGLKIPEGKRVAYADPLWAKYDETIKKLADSNIHGIEANRGLRNSLEQQYALAYQALVREGKAQQVRFKYRGR